MEIYLRSFLPRRVEFLSVPCTASQPLGLNVRSTKVRDPLLGWSGRTENAPSAPQPPQVLAQLRAGD
jgi:hypothetical protein